MSKRNTTTKENQMSKRATYYPAKNKVYVHQDPNSPWSADADSSEAAIEALNEYGWQAVDCDWTIRENGTQGLDHVKWVDNTPPFVLTLDRRW